MRILMLTQFYPPTIGGIERHVRDLSRALVARGHEVVVATLSRQGCAEFEVDEGVRIYRVRGTLQRVGLLFSDRERRCLPPWPDGEVMWGLRRVVMEERPEVVHAHNWMVHSFTLLKEWSQARLVMTLHDFSLVCAQNRFVYRKGVCTGPMLAKCIECACGHYGVLKGGPTAIGNWWWEKVARGAVDMFVPVSEAVAEGTELRRRGNPYRVVPNFIADELVCDEADPLLGQLPEEGFVLYVGDLVRDKGVEVLLRAYAGLKRKVPLVLIGRAVDDFSGVMSPNVTVLHDWPHGAVMAAWRRCALGVMPSLCADACPTVAMEAMAMGRAVIASRVGGLPDIVADGETGMLVPTSDETALRGAMESLLVDVRRREDMGEMGRRRVGAFRARTVVPRIEGVYEEVLRE